MLGVKERRRLVEAFTKGCPAGGRWDAMLFSGGGNDIVDNPMMLWLRFVTTILLDIGWLARIDPPVTVARV